jgi:hypothetical protein
MTDTIAPSGPSEPPLMGDAEGFAEDDESGTGRRFHLEIFLMAFASLLLEVAYTRIISFKLYYYYTYLVIGLALLGLGCGGVAVAISRRLRTASTEAVIMWGLLTSAATTIIGLFVVALTPIDTLALWRYGTAESVRNLVFLVVICVALFASFVAIGVMLATLFGRRTDAIGKLYFADLVGAGLACAVVVFLLFFVGPIVTILAAGLILSLAGLRLSVVRGNSLAGTVVGGALSVLLVAMLLVPALVPSIRADDTKPISATGPDSAAFTGWGAIFRVDAFQIDGIYLLMHDGMLGSAIYAYDGDPSTLTRFATDARLFPFAQSDAARDSVLIIGAAGGNEILASLYFGANDIDAVELNPVTHSLLSDRFSDYAGNIAEDPRVNYVQGDGRTFLRRTDANYDLIWFPAPDSYSATNAAASGAFVLSESYLYTTEMIAESLEHLNPSGVVVAQFGELDYDAKPNRTSRYVATARKALQDQGVDNPGDHIVVLRSAGLQETTAYTTVMVKPEPFTAGEIADLQAAVTQVPDSDIRFAPGEGNAAEGDPAATIATLPDSELEAFYDSYPFDVRPISDNGPFFWHFAPFTDVIRNYGSPIDELDQEDSLGERVLLLLLGMAVVLGAVFLLLPFVTIGSVWRKLPRKSTSVVYFASLGLGFMFFEISLIQRLVLFLGFPTYSLTVTLASVLIFTGVGALLSGRIAHKPRQALAPLAVAIAVLTAFYLAVLPQITDLLLGWPLGLRVVVAFIVLAPLGITLGMFMPLGLQAVSALSEFHREYVAWGWAVNGFASVTGAVATTVLAMIFGFNFVLVVAMFVYFIALLSLRSLLRTGASTAVSTS